MPLTNDFERDLYFANLIFIKNSRIITWTFSLMKQMAAITVLRA
jgi:hypothetical protein